MVQTLGVRLVPRIPPSGRACPFFGLGVHPSLAHRLLSRLPEVATIHEGEVNLDCLLAHCILSLAVPLASERVVQPCAGAGVTPAEQLFADVKYPFFKHSFLSLIPPIYLVN